jgi:hypothetical protein
MIPSDRYDDGKGHPMYSATLMTSGGNRQFNTSEIISRYRTDIALVLMADFLLLGHSTTGTYTAGVSKAQTFMRALTAWLDAIQDELNESGVKALMRLNGAPEEAWPRFAHDDPDTKDLAGLGTYVKALSDAGAFADSPEAIKVLMEAAGLPVDVEELEDERTAASTTTAPPAIPPVLPVPAVTTPVPEV